MAAHLLVRTRMTVTQTGLDLGARADNVSGAFRVRQARRVEGRHILLVDDVITTGATCNACSEALLGAGAASVRVAALASPYFQAEAADQAVLPASVSPESGEGAQRHLTP
jgi:predicted amidophosphoribosyltransferase